MQHRLASNSRFFCLRLLSAAGIIALLVQPAGSDPGWDYVEGKVKKERWKEPRRKKLTLEEGVGGRRGFQRAGA